MPALGARRRARRPARPLPAHPVLPEALPLLLLPRLHRQERAARSPRTSTSLAREWELYAKLPAVAGAAAELRLLRRRHAVVPLHEAARGPRRPPDRRSRRGTRRRRSRSSASRARSPRASWPRSAAMGVTRLSLGRRELRRPHPRAQRPRAPLAGDRARPTASRASLGFPQINIDLIAGMLGETEENWRRCVEKTLELEPDSVTIYQMELPFNTTISTRPPRRTPASSRSTVASWATKRRWVERGVRGARAAPAITSAAPTRPSRTRRGRRFVYRDRLWQGADMVGLGVASFGHVNGVHMQNLDTWETYGDGARTRRAPARAAPTGPRPKSG